MAKSWSFLHWARNFFCGTVAIDSPCPFNDFFFWEWQFWMENLSFFLCSPQFCHMVRICTYTHRKGNRKSSSRGNVGDSVLVLPLLRIVTCNSFITSQLLVWLGINMALYFIASQLRNCAIWDTLVSNGTVLGVSNLCYFLGEAILGNNFVGLWLYTLKTKS